jgi:hypothetical protein
MASMDVRMAIMLSIIGQNDIHQAAYWFIESVGVADPDAVFSPFHFYHPSIEDRFHHIFAVYGIAWWMAAKNGDFHASNVKTS